MRYAFGEGGTVLLPGRRYDLEKAITAAEEVLDALVLRMGNGRGDLTTDHAAYDRRFPWPRPAKDVARAFWDNASALYEGVHEPLVIDIDPIRVRWYVLGRVSVEYDGSRDLVVGGGGKEVAFVDPEPCLVIYGEPNANMIAAISQTIDPVCTALGLGLRLAHPGPMISEFRVEGHVAVITFPHDRYGNGEGPIRVRCVSA